jgi:hypothetical protein
LEINRRQVVVETNLALGYLLDNQWKEAEKVYVKWKGKTFPDRNQSWNDIFAESNEGIKKAMIWNPSILFSYTAFSQNQVIFCKSILCID